MPFTSEQFATTRPYVYHLTSARNLKNIRTNRVMYSTAEVLRASGNLALLGEKRSEILTVEFDGETLDIRDQKPLYKGKTSLEGGWTFTDLIRELNERVFFWPGWEEKPIAYGERHFERYASAGPRIVRIRTSELFAVNKTEPLYCKYCKYNSGSPRTTQGKGSPRGPNTFVEGRHAAFTSSNVVEVTFKTSVNLPDVIESASTPFGPWKKC